ncbi:hypothetical protein BO82DRAFT_187460 [Aspergillus uvarum CBS 121591]|uniref:Uncharacterized protein n=1 Tax=Aspergillus uvarum CBS 121591 TaxID=1448315 RepID=A0A319BYJ6_9EURO|nr:hypothetical protein BO82DRAFT_187460 [Aspergillus uvarum CBS 121591]PYH77207.1 hypothetical protein BO82DRAFT_187460 [Aspergillus uvarum CBS 121591]
MQNATSQLNSVWVESTNKFGEEPKQIERHQEGIVSLLLCTPNRISVKTSLAGQFGVFPLNHGNVQSKWMQPAVDCVRMDLRPDPSKSELLYCFFFSFLGFSMVSFVVNDTLGVM